MYLVAGLVVRGKKLDIHLRLIRFVEEDTSILDVSIIEDGAREIETY